ncbi:ABC transporter ATP-binding/permease protein YojI [Tenacibaculum sp. 190524A02b]|uniref:ABC transporter ATP-binding/permease protein YojI n=1 Tax=Tenacibaculum vairaonense TaxID=3137860 RepID=A0ABM9PQI9_9FLAO
MKFISRSILIVYLFIALFSGFSGFMFITLVNEVISTIINSKLPSEHNYLLLFATVITVFFISRRLLSEGIIEISQKIFWDIRAYVVKAIIKAPYPKVKQTKDELYSALTVDVNNITNASLVIISFTSAIILVLASFIYLVYLSVPLFIVSLLIILTGTLAYLYSSRKGNKNFMEVRAIEQKFMHYFNGVLNGNKEIKVNQEKGKEIYNKKVSLLLIEGKEKNTLAYIGYLNSQLISQMLFYIIITFILLYAGMYFKVSIETSISFVFALLFLLNPIVTIMLAIPPLNQGIVSYNKLKYLKEELADNGDDTFFYQDSLHDNFVKKFEKLTFKDYSFEYEENSFQIGPVNLSVHANEIIFIHGGNGAGKTTFINLLLNIYAPKQGEVYFNDKLFETPEKINQLFAPVFNDFYLFDDFYGIKNIDNQKLNSLLLLFEIADKVKIENGYFSTTDLSTGQRKRLALITAILEDRPILVLDEWAADQDPYFRKKFYSEIIHKIVKEENKTIIAITHDDSYYHEANRLFKMNYGKLEEIKNNITPIKETLTI